MFSSLDRIKLVGVWVFVFFQPFVSRFSVLWYAGEFLLLLLVLSNESKYNRPEWRRNEKLLLLISFFYFFFFFIDARKLTKQPHPMNTNNNYNCQEICAQMFDLCLVYVRQILVDFYTAKYIWIRNFETEQTTLIVSILFWLVILDWNFLADRFGLNFWKIQMKKRHLKMSIHQKKKTEHL